MTTASAVRCRADEIRLADGRVLLILRVESGEHVHETAQGDTFLRVGDESRRLSYGQRRELKFDRGSAPFDGTAVDADPGDLDPAQVDSYRSRIGAATAQGMLAARDLRTRNGRPISTGQVAELASVARPTALRHLQALRRLELVTWDGQSVRDPRASWVLR